MAAARAMSRSFGSFCGLGGIIIIIIVIITIDSVGLNLVLAQDHRFRINVYDDYQHQQQIPDYQDYQNYQNQNYQTDQHQQHDYQDNTQQNQNYQTDQHQTQNYQPEQQQIQDYQTNQHQIQNDQPDQQQIQDYQDDQHHRQNYQTQQHQNEYQKQYQQQFEDRYKTQYVKPPTPKKKPKKNGQDFSKIPGVPGVDFPIYHSIPKTSFSCSQVPYLPGMYANVETGCQVYHVCHDGREGEQGASFLCSNGTLFNQNEFACDWWYNVKCHDSFRLYSLNGDATTNPFVPKAKQEEILKGREIGEKFKIAVF